MTGSALQVRHLGRQRGGVDCRCPMLDAEHVHPVPPDPVLCACCGAPLELACANRCRRPRSVAPKAPKPLKEYTCRGCGDPIEYRGRGRPPVWCGKQRCLKAGALQ